jgi:Tfp pilus assembly protein PilX
MLINRANKPFNGRLSGSSGGVLIGILAAMVVMGVLGAGMVSMLGTSSFYEVRANHGERANYLAESGFRYAVSEYRHNG